MLDSRAHVCQLPKLQDRRVVAEEDVLVEQPRSERHRLQVRLVSTGSQAFKQLEILPSGEQVKVLLDTGAERSLINVKVARRLSRHREEATSKGIALGKASSKAQG